MQVCPKVGATIIGEDHVVITHSVDTGRKPDNENDGDRGYKPSVAEELIRICQGCPLRGSDCSGWSYSDEGGVQVPEQVSAVKWRHKVERLSLLLGIVNSESTVSVEVRERTGAYKLAALLSRLRKAISGQ